MTRNCASGDGLTVPLTSRTVDDAIRVIARGGNRFCDEQTFDFCEYDPRYGAGEEVAVSVDVLVRGWLEV